MKIPRSSKLAWLVGLLSVASAATLRVGAGQQTVPFENSIPVAPRGLAPRPLPDKGVEFDTAEGQRIRVVVVTKALSFPWSFVFLPDGSMLITERFGKLRIIRKGVLDPHPVAGAPASFATGESGLPGAVHGLMDIALHPRFSENRFVYLTYTKPLDEKTRTVALARGRWDGGALTEVKDIFVAERAGTSRIAFGRDGTLFMTTTGPDPQDPNTQGGKVLRLRDDGTIPSDNPFVGRPGHRPEVYTLGHRSALGLALHPGTGEMWQNENGPNGGDEINILRPGRNYGWPLVSYRRRYEGPWQANKSPGAMASTRSPRATPRSARPAAAAAIRSRASAYVYESSSKNSQGLPGTSATAASNSRGIVRWAAAMRGRYASDGGAERGAGPGPRPTGPGPAAAAGGSGGEAARAPWPRRRRRGRSGPPGTWRAPGCAPRSGSPRRRAARCSAVRSSARLTPSAEASWRSGIACSRCMRPRSGRASKSALRTSVTPTPSSSASACAKSSGRTGVSSLSLSSAAFTLSASTLSASREPGGEARLALLVQLLERRGDLVGRDAERLGQRGGELVAAIRRPRSRGRRGRPSPARRRPRRACRPGPEAGRLAHLPEAGRAAAAAVAVRALVAARDGRAVVRLGADPIADGRDRKRASDDDHCGPSPRLHAASLARYVGGP